MAPQGNQRQGQDRPTGTSGRQSGSSDTRDPNGTRPGNPADTPRPRVNRDDDEDSLLGNRTTNR